jgi:hypothetical protein
MKTRPSLPPPGACLAAATFGATLVCSASATAASSTPDLKA